MAFRLPYFDVLLKHLEQGHPVFMEAFGRHVHWGYWPDPSLADGSPEDFAQAAERLSRLVWEAAYPQNGQRLLEVGCGLGGTLESLDRRFTALELVGLNLDFCQLQWAKRHVVSSEGNILDWVQADACALPFESESFDSVLAVECIFHFPSRKQFFEEAHRVLKPGGYLALSDFVPIRPLRPLMRFGYHWPGFWGRCDFRVTLDDYRRLAETSGFVLTHLQDITDQTLPTYQFLKTVAKDLLGRKLFPTLETAFAEWTSRFGWLRYCILGFRRSCNA